MINVKKVGAEAIPQIINLANLSWKPTYKDILSAEQMNYMMDLFFAPTSLQKQINDGYQFIIALDDKKPVGFAAYSQKNIENIAGCKLHKIYIDPSEQGKGIGKILLNFIINDNKINGINYIELNMHREEDLAIGNNYFMNDYVMQKNIR
jgi:GNAT superfamily N-acetyltransferase